MTKNKHHGQISKSSIISSFKYFNFQIENYIENNNEINVIVTKDYSKSFNIKFDGKIKLDVLINPYMFENFCVFTYPKFIEVSNIIPKKPFYHVYSDGSLCYAPPKRPLDEKWKISDFINAVDSLIFNYFCIEYIGTSNLLELEHGNTGQIQYEVYRKIANRSFQTK